MPQDRVIRVAKVSCDRQVAGVFLPPLPILSGATQSSAGSCQGRVGPSAHMGPVPGLSYSRLNGDMFSTVHDRDHVYTLHSKYLGCPSLQRLPTHRTAMMLETLVWV